MIQFTSLLFSILFLSGYGRDNGSDTTLEIITNVSQNDIVREDIMGEINTDSQYLRCTFLSPPSDDNSFH